MLKKRGCQLPVNINWETLPLVYRMIMLQRELDSAIEKNKLLIK